MKAISLWQPYATLMASGAKRIETRDWQPHGLRAGQLVAIHAAKHWTAEERVLCAEDVHFRYALAQAAQRGLWNGGQQPPLGGIVAIARYVGAYPTERLRPHLSETERVFGNYQSGRYGWVFSEVRPLAIIPATGKQGLFDWEPLRDSEMSALYVEPASRMPAETLDALMAVMRQPSPPEPTRPPSAPSEPAEPPSEQPTRVVHCRRDAYDVYVGRAVKRAPDLKPLGWGNPFSDGLDTPAGRLSAIDRYREWVLRQPQLLARLPELRGKRLGCWCAPEGGLPGNLYGHTCHGEVLAALADGLSGTTPERTPERTPEPMGVAAFAAEATRLLDAWARGEMPDVEER